ncbi:hypothetical protein NitYY0826_C0201 [Nitratiruptor sp. YY08-26]|nr:hypothetical protein NitYY0813_C0201 [Nitratiruptor sp. YY08-13]BCD65295.1 hypothetical protein NitYY0826_C0201 [Nitratiruptor sp. YY08-26]
MVYEKEIYFILTIFLFNLIHNADMMRFFAINIPKRLQ